MFVERSGGDINIDKYPLYTGADTGEVATESFKTLTQIMNDSLSMPIKRKIFVLACRYNACGSIGGLRNDDVQSLNCLQSQRIETTTALERDIFYQFGD